MWAAALGSLLLLPAACNVPGTDDEGYVVLDAQARRAGLRIEVSGEARPGLLPVAVTSEETVVLTGPERREVIDLARGQIAYVRGASGVIELGTPERDIIRVSASEAPARAFAERMGITPLASGRGRWLFRGKDVLPIAALFDDAKGIYGVEPVYTAPTGEGAVKAPRGQAQPADRPGAQAAEEDEALAEFMAEHNGEDDDSGPELSPAEARLARERIEKSLRLELSLEGKSVFEVSESIPLRAELENRAWAAVWVVKPGDGSEMGWREPYLYLTAQREESPGVWVDVAPERYGRCGNYDEAWDRDLMQLPPGGTLKIDRLVPPEYTLDLQREGRVRLYAHYKYRAGKGQRSFFGGRTRVPPELAGVPAYEIVSAPVEIQIVRPVDVVLTARTPLELDPSLPVDSVFDVSVMNRGSAPLTVAGEAKERWQGERAEVSFEVEGARSAWPSAWSSPKIGFEGEQILRPGMSLSLLASGQQPPEAPPARGDDLVATRIRARVIMYSQGGEWRRSVKSNWIDATLPARAR